ncbi:MAG: YlxR family protein [Thermodesulfobacteriota bacterium]|jgi:predicted RNA-binding protein YlxR (DUF448 family)
MTRLIGQRTCRVCRKKKDKKELLRMVILNTKTLELDPKQIIPGRGWYLCRRETCLSGLKAAKNRHKAFGRDLEIGPRLNNFLTLPPAGGVNGQN